MKVPKFLNQCATIQCNPAEKDCFGEIKEETEAHKILVKSALGLQLQSVLCKQEFKQSDLFEEVIKYYTVKNLLLPPINDSQIDTLELRISSWFMAKKNKKYLLTLKYQLLAMKLRNLN